MIPHGMQLRPYFSSSWLLALSLITCCAVFSFSSSKSSRKQHVSSRFNFAHSAFVLQYLQLYLDVNSDTVALATWVMIYIRCSLYIFVQTLIDSLLYIPGSSAIFFCPDLYQVFKRALSKRLNLCCSNQNIFSIFILEISFHSSLVGVCFSLLFPLVFESLFLPISSNFIYKMLYTRFSLLLFE